MAGRRWPFHPEFTVVVFRAVAADEVRRVDLTLVLINAAAPPTEVSFTAHLERVAGMFFDPHLDCVAEAKDFPVGRLVVSAISPVPKPRDHATQPAVVSVRIAQPRSFPSAGDVARGMRGRRFLPVAVESRTPGDCSGEQYRARNQQGRPLEQRLHFRLSKIVAGGVAEKQRFPQLDGRLVFRTCGSRSPLRRCARVCAGE